MAFAFGPYDVLARIATGGMAQIFLARQRGIEEFHRAVCLKTLLPSVVADPAFLEMFGAEARIAARLNHPHCINIYDFGEELGIYYLSMEYIAGETLERMLSAARRSERPLPTNLMVGVVAAIAEALHHAHELRGPGGESLNMVHRDVSAENIMLSIGGHIKLIDFGIAKANIQRQETATGLVKGKFSYMSPEQLLGKKLDRRTDIYSLGLVLFEVLTNRKIYPQTEIEKMAIEKLDRPPPLLRQHVENADPRLEQICAQAMATIPSDRFSTALEMAQALRDYLSARQESVRPESIVDLMKDRLGVRFKRKAMVVDLVMSPQLDEKVLLETLGAERVTEETLFPPPAPRVKMAATSTSSPALSATTREPPTVASSVPYGPRVTPRPATGGPEAHVATLPMTSMTSMTSGSVDMDHPDNRGEVATTKAAGGEPPRNASAVLAIAPRGATLARGRPKPQPRSLTAHPKTSHVSPTSIPAKQMMQALAQPRSEIEMEETFRGDPGEDAQVSELAEADAEWVEEIAGFEEGTPASSTVSSAAVMSLWNDSTLVDSEAEVEPAKPISAFEAPSLIGADEQSTYSDGDQDETREEGQGPRPVSPHHASNFVDGVSSSTLRHTPGEVWEDATPLERGAAAAGGPGPILERYDPQFGLSDPAAGSDDLRPPSIPPLHSNRGPHDAAPPMHVFFPAALEVSRELPAAQLEPAQASKSLLEFETEEPATDTTDSKGPRILVAASLTLAIGLIIGMALGAYLVLHDLLPAWGKAALLRLGPS